MASGSTLGGRALAADATTVVYTVSPFEDEAVADVELPPGNGKRGSITAAAVSGRKVAKRMSLCVTGKLPTS